ncbi:formylglycine-generating enzyme family protein [Sediminibacterium roseum]|nr:formylglycine-generating enzyme family protein [Sediminibacterium roseum]
MRLSIYLSLLPVCSLLFSCKENAGAEAARHPDSVHACMQVPARFPQKDSSTPVLSSGDTSTANMVLIPGGTFAMGADTNQANADEYPKHEVTVSAFYIDRTEVTNAEFEKFVRATGYITTAERKPDWEEMKKTLPPGTPRPPDNQLVAASLVFKQTQGAVDLDDYGQWWAWVPGADWRHPEGPGSTIKGKEDYPVVQVSWFDAMAYCKWAGKQLPTEAQWEFAARGGLINTIYPWGNEHVNAGKPKANTWEGKFPYSNDKKDGYLALAPVKKFAANGYGLYDMAGNVWEWCSDWYDAAYYKRANRHSIDPKGADKSNDPSEPMMPKRILRGGSFLCNDSYCSGYRVSRRMRSSPDTGLEHTGFRCVKKV